MKAVDDHVSQLKFDMSAATDPNAGVMVQSRDDGPGYVFDGSLGMKGTIIPSETDKHLWLLRGEFVVPTTGYSVGKPSAVPFQQMHLDPEKAMLTGDDSMILVHVPIKLPDPNQQVTREEQKVPLSLDIRAAEKAVFIILLQ